MLEATGYEKKQGKQIAVRKTDRKRFVRLDTMEAAYHEQNLRRRLGEEPAEQAEEHHRDFNIVLDIQQIIAKNKGANYERWAKAPSIDLLIIMSEFFDESLDYIVLWKERRKKEFFTKLIKMYYY